MRGQTKDGWGGTVDGGLWGFKKVRDYGDKVKERETGERLCAIGKL